MNPICSFDGDFRFLSNFFILPEPISTGGIEYMTTENAFQAAKTLDRSEQIEISIMTPGQSKKKGRDVSLRSDWLNIRVAVMVKLLRMKFEIPALKKLLLETDSAILIEGNNWHDNFWGFHLAENQTMSAATGSNIELLCTPDSPYNHLGRALMLVREEILINNALFAKSALEMSA